MGLDPRIQLQVDASISRFQIHEAALKVMLRTATGKDVARRAIRVEAQAKRNASNTPRNGPNSGSPPGEGPAVRSGRLRASITWRLGEDAIGVYADIGSSVWYAPLVEGGTRRMAARPFLRPALQAARI